MGQSINVWWKNSVHNNMMRCQNDNKIDSISFIYYSWETNRNI